MSLFSKHKKLIRIFLPSALLTILLGGLIFAHQGLSGAWLFAVLVILEVTFSFDNAVVNSKVLAGLSPFWQRIFLTIGIFIAVFLVRFILPILIVVIASGHSFPEVIDLAFSKPREYSSMLQTAAPMINAFGGAFLVMIAVSFFIDYEKRVHWLSHIEPWMARAGRFENIKVCLMLSVAVLLYALVEPQHREIILISSVLGILLHVGIELFGSFFDDESDKEVGRKTGWAAFASLIYLEILDASFSFDGVIGAFAITSSIILIVAGLGAGAIWVRSLTVYLVETSALSKYKYLESGAHWAILALGIIMFAKLFHIELPEWATGGIGLLFISLSIGSSLIEAKKMNNVRSRDSH